MTKATGITELIQSEALVNNKEFSDQLMKMAKGLNNLGTISSWKLGDIRQSVMTEEYFQAKKGNNWVVLRGQDITGSDLHAQEGFTVLPSTTGIRSTFGQARTGEGMLFQTSPKNKAHSHAMMNTGARSFNLQAKTGLFFAHTNSEGRAYMRSNNNLNLWTYISQYVGEWKAQPHALIVNFFIKINNEPTNF